MRIELLGPSGVGKTTILRAAQEMRAHDPEWIGPLEANEILHKSPGSSRKALTRRAIDNPDRAAFVDHCLSVVTSSSMLPSQKFTALSILQTSFYQTLLLEDVPEDTTLVHDELLLHRAYSLLPYSDNVEHDAMTYFELVPLPDAAVASTPMRKRFCHEYAVGIIFPTSMQVWTSSDFAASSLQGSI